MRGNIATSTPASSPTGRPPLGCGSLPDAAVILTSVILKLLSRADTLTLVTMVSSRSLKEPTKEGLLGAQAAGFHVQEGPTAVTYRSLV